MSEPNDDGDEALPQEVVIDNQSFDALSEAIASPLPPTEDLCDLLHDRIGPTSGRLISSKPVLTKTQREGKLTELTRLTEEFGGYAAELPKLTIYSRIDWYTGVVDVCLLVSGVRHQVDLEPDEARAFGHRLIELAGLLEKDEP